MGQEESRPVDASTKPYTLADRSLTAIAKFLTSSKCKRVVVMTGAGISTSAGIPDFRSPDTGLYANLARLDLPYAEAVFDISFFREKPEPFYMLAHELYPGKYRPTITHAFIALLHQKRLLHMLFTQNIDCLEREAGVPGDKIVEAHGSFATQRCIDCKREFPHDEMKRIVLEKGVPRCQDLECNGLVKPDIVFFGEQLPASFFENRSKPAEADLAIVMGTSLTVQPFASLPSIVSEGTPRLLINKEQVGGLGSRSDDVLELGDCDDGVVKLAELCGWGDELQELWDATGRRLGFVTGEKKTREERAPRSRDEAVEDEVEKLTREIDSSLKVSKNHVDTEMARHRADEERRRAKIREDVTDTNGHGEIQPSAPLYDGLNHVFPHLHDKSSL